VDHSDRALLLAIRPRFANAILAGHKTVELRRQRPAVAPRTIVLLYATSPTKALVGSAQLAAIHTGTPDNLWATHGSSAAITRAEYDGYFRGTDMAVALTLTAVERLAEPIPLSRMRSHYSLEPPQSYRFIHSNRLFAPDWNPTSRSRLARDRFDRSPEEAIATAPDRH
jgi:predicted transcriptional regulator